VPLSFAPGEAYQFDWSGWIILGLIASKIVNRRGDRLVLDFILGNVSAVVGEWLFSFFGADGVNGFSLYSMDVAIIGAIVVWLFITPSLDSVRPVEPAHPNRAFGRP
jgi:uncharacterized membrane protein YeaQ/YmgE (transglycosylase-associated protein family)